MNNLVAKTQALLKSVKKALPQIRNKQVAKELMYNALQVIEEIKHSNKEEKDGE